MSIYIWGDLATFLVVAVLGMGVLMAVMVLVEEYN